MAAFLAAFRAFNFAIGSSGFCALLLTDYFDRNICLDGIGKWQDRLWDHWSMYWFHHNSSSSASSFSSSSSKNCTTCQCSIDKSNAPPFFALFSLDDRQKYVYGGCANKGERCSSPYNEDDIHQCSHIGQWVSSHSIYMTQCYLWCMCGFWFPISSVPCRWSKEDSFVGLCSIISKCFITWMMDYLNKKFTL